MTKRPALVRTEPARPALKVGFRALEQAQHRPQRPVVDVFAPSQPMPGVLPAGVKLAQDSAFDDAHAYAYGALSGVGMADCVRFIGYPALAELSQRAEYRLIVGIFAEEMTRKWLRLTTKGDGDKSGVIATLKDAMQHFKLQDVFRLTATHDGQFGRGQIYIDTGDTDDRDELAMPLVLSKAKIRRGSLKNFKNIEPVWSYPSRYDSTDPLKPDFYRPTRWFVMGKEVHASRLMTFNGRPVPDLLKPAYMFGGMSLIQMAMPTVDNWLRTRQSVSDLIHAFTVWGLKTNAMASIATTGDELFARAAIFNKMRDNRGLMVIDKETEEFFNVSASLAGLDELQAQAQEHMASVCRVPLVKLLGITPSGLNASADGEIRCFYDTISAMQEALFNAPMRRCLDLLQLNEFGAIDPDIGFEWEPLWEPTEVERATIRKTEADTAAVYINAGVIDNAEERSRLANEDASAYSNLDLSVVPEAPGDPGNLGAGFEDDDEDPTGAEPPPGTVPPAGGTAPPAAHAGPAPASKAPSPTKPAARPPG